MTDATPQKRAQKYIVGAVEDLPVGGRMIVDVGDREIGIFNVGGKFYGMLNRCPHLGGPLCVGQVVPAINSPAPGLISLDESTTMLTCPWHNWEFDITNGQSYWDPQKLKARPFAVNVENGQLVTEQEESGLIGRVKGPYQAETVDVQVEDDYIVVSLRPIRPGQPTRPAGPADRPAPVPEGDPS